MKLMVTPAIRIFSFVVLIATFIAVSGIVSTASALIHDDNADTCCELDKKDDSETSGDPCETPECNCISCIHAIVSTDIPTVKLPMSPDVRHLSLLRSFHPREYIASIEYPPESA
jgi:hypothetical protein